MWVTGYASTLDPRPHARQVSWLGLVHSLQRYRPHSGSKAERLRSAPLWAPHRLRSGQTRSTAAVLDVWALVLDYDEGQTLEDALALWPDAEAMAYTTWSHTDQAPRCRLVLPLRYPIAGSIWSAVHADVVRAADPACKDPGRAYYLPAVGAGGPHRTLYRRGDWLDLRTDAEAAEARQAEQEAARAAHIAAVRQRMRAPYRPEALRSELAQQLRTDPAARQRVADLVGARVVGDRARHAPCPACGRRSVWWQLQPDGTAGWARCNHQSSCGWAGSLQELTKGVPA